MGADSDLKQMLECCYTICYKNQNKKKTTTKKKPKKNQQQQKKTHEQLIVIKATKESKYPRVYEIQ
jgi:hypothetical protein